ncbi:helix-turn-helix domain-containing protein [Cytobacillus sp. FSL R7-0696]|uniref:helix-turn-helix domain-containing protein n=1 Tax=Cytobacillus sp. FSL R7-0696 TaxID=2921691 RepID=UPI0030F5AA69
MHYLSDYQTFNSTQELNANVDAHLKNNAFSLNDTDSAALNTIARYAVKFAGAAHLKATTLAKLIDKSEKTARRIVNKLAELGIIEKVATMRKVNGGKGANILRVLPFKQNELRATRNDQSTLSNREEREMPTETKTQTTKNENEPFNSINLSKNNVLDTSVIPSQALKSSLPSEIYDAMERYFDAEGIYKYYGILLRAKRSIHNDIIIEDNATPFVETFFNAILKYKQRKLHSLENYLYRAWQTTTSQVLRQNASVEPSPVPDYDWLNS